MRPLFFPIFISAFYNFSRNSYMAVLPLYFTQLGLGESQITFIFSSFALSVVLFSSVIGKISDQIGRVTVIRIGVLLEIVSILLYLLIPHFLVFLLARMINAVAFVALGIVAFSHSQDLMQKKDRMRLTGVFMSFQNGASAISPLVAGLLGGVLLFLPFYFSLLLTGGMYIIVAFYLKHHPDQHKLPTLSRRDFFFWSGMKEFLSFPDLRRLVVPAIGVYMALPLVYIFLPVYAIARYGAGPFELGLLALALWSCHMLQFLMGKKVQESSRAYRYIALLPLGAMLTYFAMAVAPSFGIFISVVMWHSFFDSMWHVTMSGTLSDIGEELGIEGTVMGGYYSIVKLAQFTCGILGSLLLIQLDISLLYLLLGSVLLLSSAVTWKLFQREALV